MGVPPKFDDLENVSDQTWRVAKRARGYLSEREAKFLMAAAALAPAEGSNVEIGSFMGRSTICIASICKHYELGKLVAIDPHTSPAPTDPDLKGNVSSFDDFRRNLSDASVDNEVDIRREFSYEVGRTWQGAIRFLWIDGDHTYEGAKADVTTFRRFLIPGALLAMHDVLGTHYGSLRAYIDEVLDCADFGPAGYCGSIGWAQFRPEQGRSFKYSTKRKLLAVPARQILPVAKSGDGLAGMNKLRYKVWRPLAPHGDVKVARLWRALSRA